MIRAGKRLLSLLLFCFLALGGTGYGVESARIEKITLASAMEHAIRNNFDIAISKKNLEMSLHEVESSRGDFDPVFGTDVSGSASRLPSTSVFADPEIGQKESRSAGVGITGKTSTGTQYGLSAITEEQSSNSRFSSIDPAYVTSVTLSLTQPLLRGFGQNGAMYELNFLKAKNRAELEKHKTEVGDIITILQDKYWDLLYTQGKVEAEEESLARSVDLLKIVTLEIKIGRKAPIDLIEAKAAVAERKELLLEARNDYYQTSDQLYRLMNRKGHTRNTLYRATDKPSIDFGNVDPDAVIEKALQDHPRIKEIDERVAEKQVLLSHAQNSRLPALNLTAQLTGRGIRGTSREVIDLSTGKPKTSRFVGSRGDSFDDALSGNYYDYVIGLGLSMPIGNRALLEKEIVARLDYEKELLLLAKTKKEIESDILIALRDINFGKERVEAVEAANLLAEERLVAEMKKFRAGRSTSFKVLEYQKNLTVEKSRLLSAIASLRKSFAAYHQAVGDTLEHNSITISE